MQQNCSLSVDIFHPLDNVCSSALQCKFHGMEEEGLCSAVSWHGSLLFLTIAMKSAIFCWSTHSFLTIAIERIFCSQALISFFIQLQSQGGQKLVLIPRNCFSQSQKEQTTYFSCLPNCEGWQIKCVAEASLNVPTFPFSIHKTPPQSLFWLVPQESHSQAGLATFPPESNNYFTCITRERVGG